MARPRQRGPHLGGRLPPALAARQDRALDPRRQLHRLLQLEDLRQGRRGHLGNAADRLSAHAARHAQPRAARLLARGLVQLVPVQRQPGEVPDGARPPGPAVARGAQDARRRSRRGRRSSRIQRRRRSYKSIRGRGGFVRATWDEVNEIIAAANVYTIKKYGPDRVIGFSPIPAMSMVSYAAGSRYLSLIGGVCMSFYDWYCDLPPASPQIWGEQTDVPESADWYNSHFIIAWGSNVPQTRTPGRALLHRSALQGHQDRRGHAGLRRGREARRSVAASEAGHRRRARHGDGPRDPARNSTSTGKRAVLRGLLPALHRPADAGAARRSAVDSYVPDRFLRATDFPAGSARSNNPEWKTVGIDEAERTPVVPQGSIGYRWGQKHRRGSRQVEPRAEGRRQRRRREARAVADRRPRRGRCRSHSPISAAPRTSIFRRTTRAATCSCATCRSADRGRRRRGARGHGVRSAVRQLRRRPGPRRRLCEIVRRRRAVHADVAGNDHRRQGGACDRSGARVRRDRRENRRPVAW